MNPKCYDIDYLIFLLFPVFFWGVTKECHLVGTHSNNTSCFCEKIKVGASKIHPKKESGNNKKIEKEYSRKFMHFLGLFIYRYNILFFILPKNNQLFGMEIVPVKKYFHGFKEFDFILLSLQISPQNTKQNVERWIQYENTNRR